MQELRRSPKGTAQRGVPRRPRVFYGWWIVLAGLLVNYYVAGTFFYGFSAFFRPITEEFGWSRAMVALAFSVQASEFAVMGPFAGLALDRFGPRKVMLFGIVMTALGFFALSAINSLWSFYASYLTISLGLSFGSFLAATTAINNWFDRKKGRAMAVLSLGAGLGATLAPLLVLAIGAVGWRSALRLVGIGVLLVGIPAALVMRRTPEEYGFRPDGVRAAAKAQGSMPERAPLYHAGQWPEYAAAGGLQEEGLPLREALRSRSFWQIGIATAFGFFLVSGMIPHQIPALESFGLTAERGALIISIMGIASLTGRWIGGTMADFMDKRRVLALAFALMFLGGLLFANIHTFWHAVLFALVFGPGFGASIPTRPAILGEYFGRRAFGSLIGIMFTVTGLGGAAGPVFAGWMFDHFQSYRLAYILMSLPVLASIALYLTLRRPRWAAPGVDTGAQAPGGGRP